MLIPYSSLNLISASIAAVCEVGLLGFFAFDVAAKEVVWNSGGVVVSRPRRYCVRVDTERRSKRSVNVIFLSLCYHITPSRRSQRHVVPVVQLHITIPGFFGQAHF
jgi:hypothetical protein